MSNSHGMRDFAAIVREEQERSFSYKDWEQEDENYNKVFKDKMVDNPQWVTWQTKLYESFFKRQEEEREKYGITNPSPEKNRRTLLELVSQLAIPKDHQDDLVNSLMNDMYRMGVINELWEKPRISDIQIMVPFEEGQPQYILYYDGERKLYDKTRFRNYDHVRDWVNMHMARLGLRHDPAKIQTDGMFPGGERIHIISNCSGYSIVENGKYSFIRGMIITFRRFTGNYTLEDFTDKNIPTAVKPKLSAISYERLKIKRKTIYTVHSNGAADRATIDYIRILSMLRKNYVLSGGTGVGKTSLVNAATAYIDKSLVLLIMEESPEMQPQLTMPVIRLYQDKEKFTLEDALKAAKRMFPDIIFLSEIRDFISFVFLQTIQSGHEGSSSTIHTNDCESGIQYIIDTACSHPSKPDRNIVTGMVYEHIDTMIHMKRLGAKRYMDEIVQLLPDRTSHKVMEYVQEGVDETGNPIGYFAFHGPTDDFIIQMMKNGIEIPSSWGITVFDQED